MNRLFSLVFYASVLLLNGCTGIIGFWMAVGGVAAVPVAGYELTRDRSVDRNLKPYGAHWVKDGMTRESRLGDFVQCGGGADLRENYAEWLSTIPYETYSAGKTQHIRTISDCMKSKNYAWQDSCDTRCLYP